MQNFIKHSLIHLHAHIIFNVVFCHHQPSAFVIWPPPHMTSGGVLRPNLFVHSGAVWILYLLTFLLIYFLENKSVPFPSLENRKIAISQLRFERFRRNLAWWCSLTLLTAPTVKNLKYQKSKMAAAAIKKSKNSHISAPVGPISTKFGKMMQFHPLDRPTVKNLKFSKSNPRWRRQPS